MKQKRLYTVHLTEHDDGKTYGDITDLPIYSFDGTNDGRFVPVFTDRGSLEKFIWGDLLRRIRFYLSNLKNCRMTKLIARGPDYDTIWYQADLLYNKEGYSTDYLLSITLIEQLVKVQ